VIPHASDKPNNEKPTILILTTGHQLYREYLLQSIAQHASVWLFHDREPRWEKPYVLGNTVISSQDAAAMVLAARSLPAGVRISGVLCWNEMRIVQAAELAQALGLPGTAPENVMRCRDKHLTREALATVGVPQPTSVLVSTVEEAHQTAALIGYPVIVKPRDMGASYGVSLVHDAEQLSSAFVHAQSARGKDVPQYERTVLIEEYMDGPEVSVDTAWLRGKMFPLYLARKVTGFYPHFEEVGHFVDAQDPLLQDPTFLGVLEKAHHAVGFQDGITHTELRLTTAGPKIVEINARLAGDMIPYVGWVASGISPGQVAVEVACGREPAAQATRRKIAAIRFFYPPNNAVVGSVRIDTSLLPENVETAAAVASPGQKLLLPPADHVFCRYGYVVVHAATVEACEVALDQAERAFTLEASPLNEQERQPGRA
jgi:biotin carboxylase